MMDTGRSEDSRGWSFAVATACSIGVLLYWTYFHRVETHLRPVFYLQMLCLITVADSIGVSRIYDLTATNATGIAAALSMAMLFGAYGSCLIWRIFFNPLNRFPGPFAARISSLWFSWKLGNCDAHLRLKRLHDQYGPYLRIGSNDLSIIDPDIMPTAHSSKSGVTKAPWYDSDYPLVSMHTTRDRALHDRRRRVWAPAFSENAVRDYESIAQELNASLVSQVEKSQGRPMDMSQWFSCYSFDAMGRMAFGSDYGLLRTGKTPEVLTLLKEGMLLFGLRLPAWVFRIIVSIPGAGTGYKKFCDFCAAELASKVKRASCSPGKSQDIVSHLLEAYKMVDKPEDDLLLQADAKLIIVAGSDTTAATLTHLFFHIAKDTEVAKKLRREVDDLTDETSLRNAAYLNSCIDETLRLHPPVPSGVQRVAPSAGLQVGNVHIPGNTVFFNPMYVMGRDPANYVDPEEFIPERWTTEREKVRVKQAYAPFSAGPYACIGKSLALMELRTLTARLIQAFDVAFAAGEDGTNLLNKSRDHFTFDLAPLKLCFKSRNKSDQ